MKSVVLFLLLAVFVLSAAVVSADQTNWILGLKATDLNDMHHNVLLSIGCVSGFTDGIDRGKGESVEPSSPLPDTSIATVVSVFDVGEIGVRDFRQPLTEKMVQKKWTIKIFTLTDNGPNLGPIKLTVSPYTDYTPAYIINGTPMVYTFYGSFIPGGSVTYSAANPMPSSFSWVVGNVPVNPTDLSSAPTLTVIASVPEPSSLAALVCGICGLGVSTFRKRR